MPGLQSTGFTGNPQQVGKGGVVPGSGAMGPGGLYTGPSQVNAPSGYNFDPNNPGHFIESGASRGTEAGNALTGLQRSLSPELQGLLFGTNTTTAGNTGLGHGGPNPPHVPGFDTSAAVGEAFGRAKDKIGLQARGALTGLSNAMAARGMASGGLMSSGIRDIADSSAQRMADVTTGQAVKDSQLAQENARTNYEGDITQRGQDVTAEGNRLQNQAYLLSQRRQTIEGLLNSFGGLKGGAY